MSFLDDAWDVVSSAVSSVTDVAGDVFDALPGSGPLKDLVNGPLRDFAKTPVGMTVLRSIATAIYGPLANSLVYWGVPFGAQMATIAWATPGLVRGEPFDEAWMLEFRWRAEKTAETLGPGILDTFGAQLKTALDQLATYYNVGELVDLTAEQLASQLGIRVDVAQYVIDLWNRVTPPPRDAFDLKTGRRLNATERAINRSSFTDARSRTTSSVTRLDRSSFTDARSRSSSSVARLFSSSPAMRSSMREPIVASSGGRSSSRTTSRNGDFALAATIVLAAGALLWWHREESRR